MNKFAIKISVIFAIFALVLVPALGKDYKVQIPKDTTLEGVKLEAGQYKLKLDETSTASIEKDGKVVCYQKEGINAGASALIRHFPEQDINVVILSNMEEGVWKPIRKIHQLVVDGKIS